MSQIEESILSCIAENYDSDNDRLSPEWLVYYEHQHPEIPKGEMWEYIQNNEKIGSWKLDHNVFPYIDLTQM